MGEITYMHASPCIYEIDGEDCIVFCNEQWDLFARENNGEDIVFNNVQGKLLWNYLVDPSTADLYRRLVKHVRSGQNVRFNLRCDSPDKFRLLEMSIVQGPSGRVRFETRLKSVASRETQGLGFAESDAPLLVCSWCGRVNTREQIWEHVEIAVNQLRIFERQLVPAVSHGICPDCYGSISGLLGQEG